MKSITCSSKKNDAALLTRRALSCAAVVFMLATPPLYAAEATPSPQTQGASFFSGDDMRSVMTFNLRRASDKGERSWETRRPMVSQLIGQYRPVFFGTQEGFHQQIEDLKKDLPDYKSVGVSRQGNTEDEYSAIFYDASRATLVDGGDFWLSETPNKAGSIMKGTGHPRMVSWGKFTIKGVDHPVYFFNTHLALEENVSERQVELFIQQINKLASTDAEVFVTGDFNIIRLSSVWKRFIDSGFQDAWQMAQHRSGPEFSFHGWQGVDAVMIDGSKEKSGFIIDWIMHRGPHSNAEQPLLVNIIPDHQGNVYPSDHFPVVLTNLGSAVTSTGPVSVSTHQAKADKKIEVTASVTNTGGAGVVPTTLYVDRKEVETQWTTLAAKQTKPVTFTTQLYVPGPHDMTIDLVKAQSVNLIPVSAAISYGNFSAPSYVKSGAIIPISADVRNSGSYQGSITANFFVDNILTHSAVVAVAPGEAQEVGFAQQFASPGLYQVGIGNQQAQVSVMMDLPSQWQFAKGDNAQWAVPAFNDSAWQKVTLPEAWEVHSDYTEDFVYGWYRTSFTVPQEWQGQDIQVILGRIDDAEQSFFNGEKIGQTGQFPTDEGGFYSAWSEVRSYTVPASLIKYGKENVIAIRVYDDMGGGGLYGGPLGVLPLGNK